MRSLFSPAVALMNTLRYTSKFALLGLAMGAVMLSLLFTVYVNLNRDIEAARLELNGLQVLKPMNKLAQFMQQHRGLSSGVLNGNEAMKEKRAAKEKEVVQVLTATEAVLPPQLRGSERWKSVRQAWESIQTQGLSWTAPENIKRHTAMIDTLSLIHISEPTRPY